MSGEMVAVGNDKRNAIMQALKSSFYLGAKDESVLMVLSYCQAAGLDPMTKPVHIVPMSVKDAKTGKYDWRDVVMPGIELYRTKASRTNAHAGTSEPEFGPTIEREFKGKDKNNKDISATVSFPEWCRVTVKRIVGTEIVEFTAKEFWIENYSTAGRDTDIPNSMWTKRPFGQLAKCSESQALRKGFPEVGAQPTADEMAGKTIEAEWVDAPVSGQKPPTDTPKSKSQQITKTLSEYAAEIISIQTVDGITDWYKKNLAESRKNLTPDEQKEMIALCASHKASLSPVEDSVSCPDREGDKVYTAYCDSECAKRDGCPSHAA
jgi:phage recombination protein Bet